MLKKGDECYIALEKRYNWNSDEMGIVANGFNYFLSFLKVNNNNDDDNDNNNNNDDDDDDVKLYGKRISLDFPQYIVNYTRDSDLELYVVYK
jgi:hypothetical protein